MNLFSWLILTSRYDSEPCSYVSSVKTVFLCSLFKYLYKADLNRDGQILIDSNSNSQLDTISLLVLFLIKYKIKIETLSFLIIYQFTKNLFDKLPVYIYIYIYICIYIVNIIYIYYILYTLFSKTFISSKTQ